MNGNAPLPLILPQLLRITVCSTLDIKVSVDFVKMCVEKKITTALSVLQFQPQMRPPCGPTSLHFFIFHF